MKNYRYSNSHNHSVLTVLARSPRTVATSGTHTAASPCGCSDTSVRTVARSHRRIPQLKTITTIHGQSRNLQPPLTYSLTPHSKTTKISSPSTTTFAPLTNRSTTGAPNRRRRLSKTISPSAPVSTAMTNSISRSTVTVPTVSLSTTSYSVHRSPKLSSAGASRTLSVSFSRLPSPRNQSTSSQLTVIQPTQKSSKTILMLFITAATFTSSRTGKRSFNTLFSRVFATLRRRNFAVQSSGVSSNVSLLNSRMKLQSDSLRQCSIRSSICLKSCASRSRT
jgi:hypothetical protein